MNKESKVTMRQRLAENLAWKALFLLIVFSYFLRMLFFIRDTQFLESRTRSQFHSTITSLRRSLND